MQNLYLHCITCHVLLCIFISDASLLRTQNSENDLKMDNDLQKYYISQTSDVEEPEYFWDSFSTQNYKEANSGRYVDIFRQNQNKDLSIRRKYPLINFIKAVDRPIEDYNTRRILDLKIRTNAKRNAEIKDFYKEKHVKDQEFENKIKEMDLANNPDTLVEVFINILKKKYPEKLLEMKNLLDKMAISGELNCSDNELVKESVPLKENTQATTINSDMVSSHRRITSTTDVYGNTTNNSATIESESSSSVSITSTINDAEKEEEEEEEEEEEYEDDNNYDNRNEDDAENYENPNNYNTIQLQLKEKLKYKKEEVKPISAGRKNRKKKLKSIIKSVNPFVSSMKPYIMPTLSKEISSNYISFTANNSDEINTAKSSSTTEMNSDEQEESTNYTEIESKVRKGTSKWKLQLQTHHITSTETRDVTETIAGPLVVSAQILVSSTEPVNSLINETASVDELDDTSLSKETTINSLIDKDAFNEEDKTSFELDSQNKNYLRRRHSKRRNRQKRIRYLNEGPQRHRKKYKGI